MRKIIQICVDGETDEQSGTLFALCDDGTVWQKVNRKEYHWEQVESIPVGVSQPASGAV